MDTVERGFIRQVYEETLDRFVLETKQVNIQHDLYSGVFLPNPSEKYFSNKPKVMVVGRETAGWNTNNKLNTLGRIVEFANKGELHQIIEESFTRYDAHMSKISRNDKSHFKRYFKQVAEALNQSHDTLVYANILAWDFDKATPLNRPASEVKLITKFSLELFAREIELFKPDVIVFATGYMQKVDPLIKMLFNQYFGGYETVRETLVSKKFWEFRAAGAKCFRIAHPRASGEHNLYRQKLLERLKRDYL